LACTPCNSRKGAKTWADFSRAFKKQHGYKPGEFDTPGFFDRLMR
jgi:AraC-like DNA-binding protein